MAKISVKDALKKWQEEHPDEDLANVEEMKLQFRNIDKMDNSLSQIPNVVMLSLSTNSIEKITGLIALKNLKILALGRNMIQSFTGIEVLADSLEQLWISYNQIDRMKGVISLKKLRVLYMSHNLVEEWGEFQKLSACPLLEDLGSVGNPCVETSGASYREEMRKRLPQLKKLDGDVMSG